MKMNLKLANTKITLHDQRADIAEFRDMAVQLFPTGEAWLILESPRQFIFRTFDKNLETEAAQEAFNIRIFGPEAEIRMEKDSGEDNGQLRVLRDDPDGEACLCRHLGALLRDNPSRQLIYEEYFKPDVSGFLRAFCGRLCGVEDSDANG